MLHRPIETAHLTGMWLLVRFSVCFNPVSKAGARHLRRPSLSRFNYYRLNLNRSLTIACPPRIQRPASLKLYEWAPLTSIRADSETRNAAPLLQMRNRIRRQSMPRVCRSHQNNHKSRLFVGLRLDCRILCNACRSSNISATRFFLV